MKSKNINVCDVLNVMAWDREIEIQDRLHTVVHTGIANRVPEKFYNYEVSELDNRFNCMIIRTSEIIK